MGKADQESPFGVVVGVDLAPEQIRGGRAQQQRDRDPGQLVDRVEGFDHGGLHVGRDGLVQAEEGHARDRGDDERPCKAVDVARGLLGRSDRVMSSFGFGLGERGCR